MTIKLRRQIKLAITTKVTLRMRSASIDAMTDAVLDAIDNSPTHILLDRSHTLRCPACGAEGTVKPDYVVADTKKD